MYNKHDIQRENFINVEIYFINAKKIDLIIVKFKQKKHSYLAFKFRKHDFTRCFVRKQWTIYPEVIVNNFLNNAEQEIILCRM